MRTIKLICGVICFVAALLPGLLVLGVILGELNFSYFNLPFAICTLVLFGVSSFLITRQTSSMSRTARVLTVLTICFFIGFVVVIVFPNFIRAWLETGRNACINNLRQIDAAAQEFALEKGKKPGDAINYPDDLTLYIKLDKDNKIPPCPRGGTYTIDRVGDEPKCSIGTSGWPNEHVLNPTNNWWKDFKMAYGKVLGLNNGLHKPQRGD
jgi:hypothetical protein